MIGVIINQIIFHTFLEKSRGIGLRLSTVNHRRSSPICFSESGWLHTGYTGIGPTKANRCLIYAESPQVRLVCPTVHTKRHQVTPEETEQVIVKENKYTWSHPRGKESVAGNLPSTMVSNDRRLITRFKRKPNITYD